MLLRLFTENDIPQICLSSCSLVFREQLLTSPLGEAGAWFQGPGQRRRDCQKLGEPPGSSVQRRDPRMG